jgi:tetratricopeptide (TPR) repeat protein
MPVEEANEALKLAQKAWDIDADFEMAEVAMANALQITGQSEDAIATLEKMLKSAPSNADAHAQLGRLLIWAGRAKEAIDPINTAVRLNPDFGSPYLIDLGLANFTSGDYEAAITAFEKNYARGGPIDDAGLAVWTASNSELGVQMRQPKYWIDYSIAIRIFTCGLFGCCACIRGPKIGHGSTIFSSAPTSQWIGRTRGDLPLRNK